MERQTYSSKPLEFPSNSAASPTATVNTRSSSLNDNCHKEQSIRLLLGSAFDSMSTKQPRATRGDAAIKIGQAYDRLHRIQAILAYLKIINRNDRWFSPILDEAKRTYEQALSQYVTRDFDGALEFASASVNLFQALEVVISNGLRSDSLYPTLVPLPPEHRTTLDDSIRIQEELSRVECLLFAIHRVVEDGVLLLDDRTQTLNITSCSEHLLRKTCHLLGFATMQEATDLVQAAALTARAAGHVCRRGYATQEIDPFLPSQPTRADSDQSPE